MLWKEIVVESGVHMNALGRIFVLVLIAACFIPVGFIFDQFLHSWGGSMWGSNWEMLSQSMNIWVRVLGSVVACLLLLAVAARASSSISYERDRQTWDALMTTPLGSDTILFAKWVGNILSVRWGWLWLGAIYVLALATGGLHPFALLLLLGAWLVYAFVVSGIGLWFSMVSRTTLRATLWTLLCTAGAGAGHWLLWMCCIPLYITVGREPAILEWIRRFQVGFTPPIALGYCFSFCWLDLRDFRWRATEAEEAILYGLAGIACWVVLGLLLAGLNRDRFRGLTGRRPLRRRLPPGAQDPMASAAPKQPTEVPS
jgi:hypothetical protein